MYPLTIALMHSELKSLYPSLKKIYFMQFPWNFCWVLSGKKQKQKNNCLKFFFFFNISAKLNVGTCPFNWLQWGGYWISLLPIKFFPKRHYKGDLWSWFQVLGKTLCLATPYLPKSEISFLTCWTDDKKAIFSTKFIVLLSECYLV